RPQPGRKGGAPPTLDGRPPHPFNDIHGDAFAPRNKKALAIDFVKEPPFFDVSPTHAAKTWYLDPRAPKVERPHSIQNLRKKMMDDHSTGCKRKAHGTQGPTDLLRLGTQEVRVRRPRQL